jgi:hypothetical protein
MCWPQKWLSSLGITAVWLQGTWNCTLLGLREHLSQMVVLISEGEHRYLGPDDTGLFPGAGEWRTRATGVRVDRGSTYSREEHQGLGLAATSTCSMEY